MGQNTEVEVEDSQGTDKGNTVDTCVVLCCALCVCSVCCECCVVLCCVVLCFVLCFGLCCVVLCVCVLTPAGTDSPCVRESGGGETVSERETTWGEEGLRS